MRVSVRPLVLVPGILIALPLVATAQTTCVAEPTDQPIAYDEVVQCQNAVGDPADNFRFDGKEGDIVRIVLTRIAGDYGNFPCFELFGPTQPAPPLFSQCGSSVVSDERTLPATGTYTIAVNEAGFNHAMDYSVEVTCLSGSCANTAVCDIQLNQATYVDGNSVTMTLFRIANNRLTPLTTEIKVWLAGPGVGPVSLVNVGSDGSVVLPAGFTTNPAPLTLFAVTGSFPRGQYELSCRVLDPTTGRLLSADRNAFVIQ